MCITSVLDVIRAIRNLFTVEPSYKGNSIFDRISPDQVHQILSLLSLQEICNFGRANKRNLTVAHSNEFWVQIYYERCRVSNSMLYIMDNPGPLRVMATSGKWVWREAREAFIRSEEIANSAGNVPGMEVTSRVRVRLRGRI
jgi:hypothetical protein